MIQVSNPGTIIQQDAPAGIGLKNLNERLAIRYQKNASFSLTEEGSKVTATLMLP
jgi:LytS/YehU family sensor histidine kinase